MEDRRIQVGEHLSQLNILNFSVDVRDSDHLSSFARSGTRRSQMGQVLGDTSQPLFFFLCPLGCGSIAAPKCSFRGYSREDGER